jgi:hypothetical protein
MEELFFAVQPIFWEGKIWVYQLSLFVMVCIFIYGTWRIIQYKKEHKVVKIWRMSIPEYAPIDPEDSEFALKTLGKLKELIWYFYAPEHSDTHTVREIGKYLFDSSLIETASRLEHAIYTWKKLSNDECKKINITIKDFINRSKKNIW